MAMADGPALNAQIVRGLNERVYDKRKAAALEVEKLIREYAGEPESVNKVQRIRGVLDQLIQDFAYSVNPNARNGGLIALAAASIALGPDVAAYLDDIVPPVLACFADQDSRVRYYACESMYNIAKVSKGEILRYFNEVFDAMSKLAADSELSVKNGAELLDRLIKDIVAEQSTTYVSVLVHPISHDDLMETVSMPRTTAFSLPRFIPLLSERIRAKNPFTRNFLVSWITVLDSIPDLELVSFLPAFLDGLLQFLSDPHDVRYATSNVLANFLAEIREAVEVKEQQKQQAMKNYFVEQQRKLAETTIDAGESIKDSDGDVDDVTLVKSSINSVDGDINWDAVSISETEGRGKGSWVPGQGVIINYTRIVEILMPHLSSPEEEIQTTALKWINEFITLAKDVIISFTPQLISAVLPSLAHTVKNIKTVAIDVNRSLYKLIIETPTNPAPPPSYSVATRDSSTHSSSNSSTDFLMNMGSTKEPNYNNTLHSIYEQADPFDYQKTVDALMHQVKNEQDETRVASLDWLLMLHKKASKKILAIDDGTFPVLLKTLSDPSDDVVKRDLQLLAQLSYNSEEYFTRFMVDLLKLFRTDRRLLESRGSLIIRHLCMSLNSERIYRSFAEILEKEEEIEFASSMVQNLNSILITSPDLSDLRKRLKSLETKDGQMLFTALYKSWCHNPVATFSLCLLAQAYEHAANLLQSFADLEINVNLLIQIDKLVQLLESPVFTYLRLQLLEPDKYPYLFKCLYGLLMLLPQSSAFASLKNRLTSVSSMGFLHLIPKSTPTADTKRSTTKPTKDDGIKFQDLLTHFRAVQTKHEKKRKQSPHSLGRSSSQTAQNRRGRDHRDKSTLHSTTTNKHVGNSSHSHNNDHKGVSGTTSGSNFNIGSPGTISTSQTKRRPSAASNTSANSDHGGSSGSRATKSSR